MAKTKLCRGCNERYEKEPSHPPFRNWCSIDCAITIARARQDRARRKVEAKQRREFKAETSARRQKMMTVTQYAARVVQPEFNRFIRWRDYDRPCISCGEYNPPVYLKGGQWDCGHFLSVGAHPELRFNELNAHKQCKSCNSHKSGNQAAYRSHLVERIGEPLVEWLEGPHKPLLATKDELEWLARYYKDRAKDAEVWIRETSR